MMTAKYFTSSLFNPTVLMLLASERSKFFEHHTKYVVFFSIAIIIFDILSIRRINKKNDFIAINGNKLKILTKYLLYIKVKEQRVIKKNGINQEIFGRFFILALLFFFFFLKGNIFISAPVMLLLPFVLEYLNSIFFNAQYFIQDNKTAK